MIIPDVDLEEEMACIAHISARLPDDVAGPDLPSHPAGPGLAGHEVDPLMMTEFRVSEIHDFVEKRVLRIHEIL